MRGVHAIRLAAPAHRAYRCGGEARSLERTVHLARPVCEVPSARGARLLGACVPRGEDTMDMSRRYLVWSLCYAAIGMGLGIYMAASHNHGQLVTHAHVLLVGFMLSLVYGIIHRLWLEAPRRAVAMTQDRK